jgi:hypothetical protein
MLCNRSARAALRFGGLALILSFAALTVRAVEPARGRAAAPPSRLETDQTAGRDAALRGRILDPGGAPLPGAIVEALRLDVEDGQRILLVVADATSDPHGLFQLESLPPGRYVVRAFTPRSDPPDPTRLLDAPAPTYYPGVNAPESASEVRAGAGRGPEFLEFRLRHVSLAKVSGRLVTHDGRPLLGAAVIMSPHVAVRGAESEASEARVQPDGVFSFTRVPPGGYVVRARGESTRGGTSLFSTFTFVVDGRDVSGLEMVLAPGGSVEGSVSIEARPGFPAPELRTLRVRAPLADGSAFGDTLSGTVKADGEFRLTSLMPGSHVVVVEGLTHPWRIADARLQGRNITEQPFDVEGDRPLRSLRILITPTAAGLSGTVTLPEGVAATDILVVAFPSDALRRRLPLRFVRLGRPAPDGAFRVLDLVPGEHLVAAVLEMAAGDALDPHALDRLAPLARRVDLQEATVTSLPLEAVRFPVDSLP